MRGSEIGAAVFSALVFLEALMAASGTAAAQVTRGYCIDAFLTGIDPTSVGISEDFTVGILIDNCGDEIPEKVRFEITDLSPYMTVKEPMSIDIGKMGYSNSKRFLLYHMRTLDNAIPGEYEIRYKLYYGKENFIIEKEGSFFITVTGERAELDISSVRSDPTLPEEGKTVDLILRIENFGEGIANSVKVNADHPFQGKKEAFIGTLNPDEDGPVVFTFIASESGEFSIPVSISYQDDFGEHAIDTSIKFFVMETEEDLSMYVYGAVIAVLFIAAILLLLRKNRKKDRVIKQILSRQDHHREEKHRKG